MANMIKVLKSEKSQNRKLPFLPRVGLVVDAFGRQFVFKGVPFAETFIVARERGFSLATLKKVAEEQLSEVGFPAILGRGLAVVKNLRNAKAEKTAVKKSAPKAAATPKKKAEKTDKSAKAAPGASADGG